VVGIGVRRLWLTALIDVALFVFYELLVTLREPAGFASLYTGLVHGPSQVLTFALPLVSPRTLLVAPVALCWLSGAILGECVARGWQTVLPYATLLVTFGLSYAGTARAITNADDGHRYDTLLAGALLLTLLLMRAAQAWVVQERAAEITQPDGVLPLRSLTIGTALSVAVALVAAAVVQSAAFTGPPTTPVRVPPVNESRPLTPVSFVAGLRPTDPRSSGRALFKVTTDRAGSNYISIASVDVYNGDTWGFGPNQTFRPSGGVIPSDADSALRPRGAPLQQVYTIDKGPMTTTPWMPYVYRAQNVTGASVNIDPDSGMIVPGRPLHAGQTYTVRSADTTTRFSSLRSNALIGTSAPAADFTPATNQTVENALGTLVDSLQLETNVPSSSRVQFLQAVAKEFQTKSSLAGAPASSGAASPSGSTTKTPTPAPGASSSASAQRTGGTSFADVLASIRQFASATPEQYATLMCLVARQIGVPARVVTGFRIPPPNAARPLPAGSYQVTSADAWTWVEIPVDGAGWAVLDPSPSKYSSQTPPPDAGATPSPSPSPSPSNNALITHSNNGHAVAKPSSVPGSHTRASAVIVIVLIVVVALLLLSLLGLILRKRLRVRRRKRSGDPRRRLLGAWQESLDVLEESGLPDLTTLTSREVSAATADRFGGEPAAQARYLGDAANAAIFSPTSWIGPAEADAAWRAQVVLGREVRRRLRWRERVGANLRYNRGRRAPAQVGPTSWTAAARARAASAGARGKHSARGRRRRGG
jgi:transglutaminase superfamily protein